MTPKSSHLAACLGAWMVAATTSAALPILSTIPQLKSFGSMGPLMVALAVGALVSLPLAAVMRRLAGLDPPARDDNALDKTNAWTEVTAGEAVQLGIISWGMPVGLIFVTDSFIQSTSLLALIPNAVIWPVGGAVMGLLMRNLAHRRMLMA